MPVSVKVSANDTWIVLRKMRDYERSSVGVTLQQREHVISRKTIQDSIDGIPLPFRFWRCHTEDQSHEQEQNGTAQSPHAFHLFHLQSHGLGRSPVLPPWPVGIWKCQRSPSSLM